MEVDDIPVRDNDTMDSLRLRFSVALEAQNEHDQMWIRKSFLEFGEEHGTTVIHGHSISSEPQVRHNRIDTGAYASGVLTCLVLDGVERTFLQT